MNKRIIITAAIFGMLSVISGAFGAHALKAFLTEADLSVWHTAVQYQFVHTLAILFLFILPQTKQNLVKGAYYCFTLGIVFFSGSLYLLSTRDIHHFGWVSVLGPVTPLGGVLFIGGWICLLLVGLKISDARV
jgi:uncharacterized membrane protein YgdD (TMEM256/DUF423 family)